MYCPVPCFFNDIEEIGKWRRAVLSSMEKEDLTFFCYGRLFGIRKARAAHRSGWLSARRIGNTW